MRVWECVCVCTTQMYLSDTITSSLQGVCTLYTYVCVYWFVVPQTSCTSVRLSPLSARHLLAPPPTPLRGVTHCAFPWHIWFIWFAFCLVPCAAVGQLNFEFSFVVVPRLGVEVAVWGRPQRGGAVICEILSDISDCSPGCQLKWRSRLAPKISRSCCEHFQLIQ